MNLDLYTSRAVSRLSILKQKWKLIALVYGKKELAFEVNNPRNGQHAEMRAIRKAGKDNCEGATLFVWRINSEGFGMAKPCKKCQPIILEAGIKKVIYSTMNGFEEWKI